MSYSLETVTSRLEIENGKYFISNHLLSSSKKKLWGSNKVMALKKKKGFRIETKTLKSKLRRQGNFVENTVRVYRQSIEFFIQVVFQHPSGVDLDRDKQRDFYDALTMARKRETSFYLF